MQLCDCATISPHIRNLSLKLSPNNSPNNSLNHSLNHYPNLSPNHSPNCSLNLSRCFLVILPLSTLMLMAIMWHKFIIVWTMYQEHDTRNQPHMFRACSKETRLKLPAEPLYSSIDSKRKTWCQNSWSRSKCHLPRTWQGSGSLLWRRRL